LQGWKFRYYKKEHSLFRMSTKEETKEETAHSKKETARSNKK